MLANLIIRIVSAIPICLLIFVMAFALLQLIPGDAAVMMLGVDATAENLDLMRERLGLNEPLVVQFFHYLSNALQGNFGHSNFLDQDVLAAIWERLPVSLFLASVSLFWAVVIGVPVGVYAAARQGSRVDRLVMLLSTLGMSMPSFWLGLLLVLLIGVWAGFLPTGGYVSPFESPVDAFRFILLPSLSLGLIQTAQMARMTRSMMVGILRQEYVTTARAKGLSERRVLYRHALPNALAGLLTVASLIFAEIMGGALVTEQIFSLPGLGQLVVGAIGFRDVAVIQGTLIVIGIGYVVINIATDIAGSFIDPRTRAI